MGIFDRLREKLSNPALSELVKEQNLKELLVKREFRISQAYLQREFLTKVQDDEVHDLSIALLDGYGTVTGKVKKRLIPFAINFSATFTIQGMEFTATRKCVFLRLEQVTPIDLEWVTRRIVERIAYLSCTGNLITCDLNRVPKLAEMFAYRVKGMNPWDFIAMKEVRLQEGEIVGRVGVVI